MNLTYMHLPAGFSLLRAFFGTNNSVLLAFSLKYSYWCCKAPVAE